MRSRHRFRSGEGLWRYSRRTIDTKWREPGEDGPELDEMLREAARIVIRGLPF
jgi:hypothetical protein